MTFPEVYTLVNFHHAMIHREVNSNAQITTPLEFIRSLSTTTNNLEFHFASQISPAEKAALDIIVSSHVAMAPRPKIESHAKEEAKNKHPHNINYKTELKISLFPKRTMTKGEVLNVKWYSDEAMTDLVLSVDIVYTRDPFGFAVSRDVTRTWKNDDESDYKEKKKTKKNYSNNPEDQIVEGLRRRQNIVNYVKLPVLSFLIETEPGTVPDLITMGRDFLDRLDSDFRIFVNNSSEITDSQDPYFGKKSIVKALGISTDTWLDNTPAALGGATIRQWLMGEFTI